MSRPYDDHVESMEGLRDLESEQRETNRLLSDVRDVLRRQHARLVIREVEGGFECFDETEPGAGTCGRGASPLEAYGSYVLYSLTAPVPRCEPAGLLARWMVKPGSKPTLVAAPSRGD